MTSKAFEGQGVSTAPTQTRRRGIVGFFNDLSLGSKLMLGFGILVFVTLFGALASFLGGRVATDKIKITDDVRVPAALGALEAQANLLRMLGDVRGYLALGDPLDRASYKNSADAFAANLTKLDQLAPGLDPDSQARVQQLHTLYNQWEALPDKLFALRDDQLDREPAYRLLATQGTQLAGSVLIDINQMIELQGSREPSQDNMFVLQDMAQFQGSFAAMLSALRGYTTTRNPAFRAEYEANLALNLAALTRLQGRRTTLSPTQQILLDRITQNHQAFLKLPDQIFAILESDDWRQDLKLFTTQAVPLADQMKNLLYTMVTDQQYLLTRDLGDGRQNLVLTNGVTAAGGLFGLILGLLLALVFRSAIAGPVRRLTGVAERITSGDLEAAASVESRDEIGTLANTFNTMTSQLRRTLRQVTREKKRADDLLNVVIPIGVQLSAEKDFGRLLERMVLDAMQFCHADTGILYLRTEDNYLRYVILRCEVKSIEAGGSTGTAVPYPPIPLYDPTTGQPNTDSMPVAVALSGTPLNIPDARVTQGSERAEILDFQSKMGFEPKSMLTIPLTNTQREVVGVLQLADALDPETNQIVPFDRNLQQMMESLSALAGVALDSYLREQALRQEIEQLRIEIDEAKRQKQVSEIVDSDFFQDLQSKARSLRNRTRQSSGTSGAGTD